MNYIGTNIGQGIKIFYNGFEMVSVETKLAGSHQTGDGRIVVGRRFTDMDQQYASVMVDELLFFNRYLTPEEISVLLRVWSYILKK